MTISTTEQRRYSNETDSKDSHNHNNMHDNSDHMELVMGAAAASPTAPTTSKTTTKKSSDGTTKRWVTRARAVVVLVLLISAVVVAVLAYTILSHNENTNFVTNFESSANQVIHMAAKNAANVLIGVEALATVYPFTVNKTQETFPYVTIDGFEALGGGLRDVAKVSAVAFVPLLPTVVELKQWNDYARQNSRWIDQGRTIKRNIEKDVLLNTTTNNVSSVFFPFVFGLDNESNPVPVSTKEDNIGPFAPVWQMTPVPDQPRAVNYNMATKSNTSILGNAIRYVIDTHQPILTVPFNARLFFPVTVDGPLSVLVHPVYDTYYDSNIGGGQGNRTVVGFIAALLAWKYFFDDILPDGPGEIMVVVQSCTVTSTFLIHGVEAKFVGDGDLHAKKYNHLQIQSEFVGWSENRHNSNQSSTAESNNDNNEGKLCRHSIHIYPTELLEATHRTNGPRNYAIVIVSIFVFAIVVFLMYDGFVSYRQSTTERRAQKSNDIVQEMFPGDVAAQLFESCTTQPTGTNNGNDNQSTDGECGSHTIIRRGYLTTKRPTSSIDGGSGHNSSTDGFRPSVLSKHHTIANLYPHATVLFADIAGFTAWSASRDPHAVFTLLESIFQAFDAIAKRLGIFKVETIGDCYVAVCGVPTANADHAIVMSRFARLALDRFRMVCHELEMTLGRDTLDLGIRIGMHSGAVTAGVLRGDRARFQLFGDTVNTASRIESTGQRDRIHVSEQTAMELMRHGKQDWIVRRSDVVEAKGKGQLVTYWMKPRSDTATSVVSSMDNFSWMEDEEENENDNNVAVKPPQLRKSSGDAVVVNNQEEEEEVMFRNHFSEANEWASSVTQLSIVVGGNNPDTPTTTNMLPREDDDDSCRRHHYLEL